MSRDDLVRDRGIPTLNYQEGVIISDRPENTIGNKFRGTETSIHKLQYVVPC